MNKPIIRLNDIVTNTLHGNGQVINGDSTVMVDGQPVACEENEVSYQDGVKKKILPGQSCVMVNGKKIALMDDSAEEEGSLKSSTTTMMVDEGQPFIFLNSQININYTTVHFAALIGEGE